MGNHCCPPSSPCGTVEERSGLLRDDSKQRAATADTEVMGLFQNSPEAEDVRKITDKTTMKEEEVKEKEVKVKEEEVKEKEVKEEEVKRSAEAPETKACNTQENGPLLQKEPRQTPTPVLSTEPELRGNSTTRAQEEDVKETAADNRRAEPPQRTLDPPQPEQTAADQEVFAATNTAPVEQRPAVLQDKIPDAVAQAAEAVRSESPSCPEADAPRERITPDATAQDNGEAAAGGSEVLENAVAEPSGDFPPSLPNSELSAAVCQAPSTAVANQENDVASPSSSVPNEAVSENGSSSACEEEAPEDRKPHDASESPDGFEPACGEEGNSSNSVSEPLTSAPAESSQSKKPDQDAKPDPESAAISLKEVTTVENIMPDPVEETALEEQEKDKDVLKAKDEEEEAFINNAETGAEELHQELNGQEEMPASASADVEVEVKEKRDSAEDSFGNSEEDLYRGVEELSASPASPLEITLPKVEDRCSLDPAVDILSYSEREWKGNTAKSALIRKGYKEMSQRFGSLRRVRGDNYCALRATLFQVLSHSTELPAWLQHEDIAMLPKELEVCEGLISHWTFPSECPQRDGTGDATQQLKGYLELLRNRWQEAVGCSSAAERQQLCERVFQGGEEELGVLEALKLLMLGRAVELHGCMQAGGDVPLFCWLLFARDSSGCPRSFLSNHLSRVGLSAGLEQVEMFLLGYALQCTIQVYRLYMSDTEEFVTYYPDDHKDDWPSVCLVTEDDRHYNVPLAEAAESPAELADSS